MRKDPKPYWLKRWLNHINRWYVNRFVRPHCDYLGRDPLIMHPRHIEIHGANIHIGDFIHMIGASDRKLRLTTWGGKQGQGTINIGHYCLLSPGCQITAHQKIEIGDNCMLAADVYIADSDWHGIYNRLRPFRCTATITLHNNVWVGHGAKILKGVTIGENAIIAAGAIVTKDVKANTIVAGNPARVIKSINPNRKMLKRELLFQDPEHYLNNMDLLDQYLLSENTFLNWCRSQIAPSTND
ncbi:acyltransferase [Marinibactrum halimedae]|uniref:Acyltransferase n=1 Tax=Marinibactrum halimedae TaxID=1444977 RepID=A0AA37T4E7_9GAMM|nr:acyltransferase [Marinibactrum halimedae]GLS24887.1 hypothetical protein GCM10007877_06010 [Marinibactrum halimedae]